MERPVDWRNGIEEFCRKKNEDGRAKILRQGSVPKVAEVVVFGLWLGFGQGTENFTNLPTASAGSYQNRTWTGTDGVIWTAGVARTDQTLTGVGTDKAICFGTGNYNATTNNKNVTSPVYAGGMGNLSFNYVRGFTGAGARTLQVFINGTQVGPNITVSQVSDIVTLHTQTINIPGNVQLEIRSLSTGQVIVDDINWTPLPLAQHSTYRCY